MNDELVKGALASFCIIPELYQQAGADVSDEECQTIIENPQAGEEILKNNEDLFNQVCQIYSQAPQEIYQAAQEKVQQQQAGMFRKGGKLAYGVSKFQRGGNLVRKGQGGTKTEIPNFGSNQSWKAADRGQVRLSPYRGFVKDRSIGTAIDENGGKYLRENASVNGNTAITDVYIPAPGDTLLRQNVATRKGMNMRYYKPDSNEYSSVMPRLRPYLENGGKTKKYQIPDGPLPKERTETYATYPDGYIQLKISEGLEEPDSTLFRLNKNFLPIESVSRFYDADGTPITYNNDWNNTVDGAKEKFDTLRHFFNRAKSATRLRKAK